DCETSRSEIEKSVSLGSKILSILNESEKYVQWTLEDKRKFTKLEKKYCKMLEEEYTSGTKNFPFSFENSEVKYIIAFRDQDGNDISPMLVRSETPKQEFYLHRNLSESKITKTVEVEDMLPETFSRFPEIAELFKHNRRPFTFKFDKSNPRYSEAHDEIATYF